MDACTDWGCGGFIRVCEEADCLVGDMRRWSDEDRALAFVSERESTGVMEGLAVVWWLSIFGDLCYGKRVLLETDNASVVFALDCCYSKRPVMMALIVDVMSLCCRYRIVLRMRHVSGVVYNCIADRLSHNDPEQAKCLALIEFGLPLLLA